MINEFGKGILPDPIDDRDYTITNEALGAGIVVWKPEFIPSKLKFYCQAGSSACGPYATSYYGEKIDRTDSSRHDLYNRVFLPAGGSYIRDNILQRLKGQSLQKDDPDEALPTEAQARMPGHGVRLVTDKDGFVIINHTIDGVAGAVQNYNGVVFGLYGTNEGWADEINPRPPKPGEVVWGHCLFVENFHLHDGVKCVLCVSSWINQSGTQHPEYHHIKENYFTSGNTFNPWTLIPKDNMSNAVFVHKPGTQEYGFFLPKTSEEALKDMALNLGREDILTLSGTVDFTKAQEGI